MHGDELVIALGINKGEAAREPKLQPHQPRQHEGNHSDQHCRERVLDSDDLSVLAKDVLREPAFRMIKFDILEFCSWDRAACAKCDFDHPTASSFDFLMGPDNLGFHPAVLLPKPSLRISRAKCLFFRCG